MDLEDILCAEPPAIPAEAYPGQPIQERIALLPDALSIEESSAEDEATFLTAAEGLALVRDYFLTGNLAESARKLKVRYAVALRSSKDPWFDEELSSLERQHKIGQKARLDGLLDKTLGQLEKRLEYGDEVMTKDGVDHIAVKARDLAAIAAILTERREKLDEATKPAASAPKGRIESLADRLRAQAAAGASNAVVVEQKQVGNGA